MPAKVSMSSGRFPQREARHAVHVISSRRQRRPRRFSPRAWGIAIVGAEELICRPAAVWISCTAGSVAAEGSECGLGRRPRSLKALEDPLPSPLRCSPFNTFPGVRLRSDLCSLSALRSSLSLFLCSLFRCSSSPPRRRKPRLGRLRLRRRLRRSLRSLRLRRLRLAAAEAEARGPRVRRRLLRLTASPVLLLLMTTDDGRSVAP